MARRHMLLGGKRSSTSFQVQGEVAAKEQISPLTKKRLGERKRRAVDVHNREVRKSYRTSSPPEKEEIQTTTGGRGGKISRLCREGASDLKGREGATTKRQHKKTRLVFPGTRGRGDEAAGAEIELGEKGVGNNQKEGKKKVGLSPTAARRNTLLGKKKKRCSPSKRKKKKASENVRPRSSKGSWPTSDEAEKKTRPGRLTERKKTHSSEEEGNFRQKGDRKKNCRLSTRRPSREERPVSEREIRGQKDVLRTSERKKSAEGDWTAWSGHCTAT